LSDLEQYALAIDKAAASMDSFKDLNNLYCGSSMAAAEVPGLQIPSSVGGSVY